MNKTPGATRIGHESEAGIGMTGMWIFLSSEAFLFGSLFFTYFYFKVNTPVWPPAGATPDSGLAIINTAILLCSSAAVWLATRLVRSGKTSRAGIALLSTAALGAVFLGITIFEWTHEAFAPWNSAYGAIFYTMTGFHALHVLGGVLLLLSLFIRTRRGFYTQARHTAVEAGALYWHYVDFIWILVFITLFLIR